MGVAYRCVVAMRAAEHGNGYRSFKKNLTPKRALWDAHSPSTRRRCQLPQLRDAAFPAFPQFCLKIFTFAGIIVQSGLTNQCEAYLRDCVGRQNPSWTEVNTMRKLLTALVAAASIGAAAIATSSSAEAWRGGWGWGPGAVVGGVIAGAVVGSAIASRPYYYPYGYYGYGPNPYYGPPCGRVWNGYAWVPAC